MSLARIRLEIRSRSKKNLEKELNRNSDLNLQIAHGKFEKGDNEIVDMIDWQEGVQELSIEETEYLVYVYEVIPPEPKLLNETRGKVIADYQNMLENNWIRELRSKYSVKINKKALNQIYEEFETN